MNRPEANRAVAEIVARARAKGAVALDEPDALAVATTLGIAAPRFTVVTRAEGIEDLSHLAGDRVVVKAILPGVAHKSELGAVRVVERTPGAVAAAMAAIEGADRFMVAEYVEHGPDAEVLLGLRWTEAFGPVVVLGAGGRYVDLLAGSLPPIVATPQLVESRLDAMLAASPLVDHLSAGFRGAPGRSSTASLASLLSRAARMAAATMPTMLDSFEINPLVFTPSGPMALDAKAVLRSSRAPTILARPAGTIDRILHPGTIAVVGVSSRMNVGRVILRNILAAGFDPARVTVIKEGADAIDGCRCVPGLDRLEQPVDLLVVAVDAAAAAALVTTASRDRRARAAIVVAGGAGERPGTESLAREMEAAGGAHMAVHGPNCLGIASRPGRFDTFFIPPHKTSRTTGVEAPLAVVSQSGAFILSRLDRSGLNPRYAVSVGNQVDLTVGDYAAHFAADEDVRILACYIEGLRPGDGVRLLAAIEGMARRGGTVVLYAAGSSAAGKAAAASHTAAVAGDHTATLALAATAGAIVAESIEEWEDLVQLAVLLEARPPLGGGIGVVVNAGFEAVAVADQAGPHLARFTPDTDVELGRIADREGHGGLVTVGNPFDLTPAAPDDAFAAAVRAVLDDPGVGAGIIGCVPFTPALNTLAAGPGHDEDVAAAESLASRLIAIQHRKPWVAVVDAGPAHEPMRQLLRTHGIPVFTAADRAARAMSRHLAVRFGLPSPPKR